MPNAWTKLVSETYRAMKKKNPKATLGDAMKEASKKRKKT
jgi:hypothetical protein